MVPITVALPQQRGDSEFVSTMQAMIDGDKELSEILSPQRRPMQKPLEYYANTTDTQNDTIVIAYAGSRYTLQEIEAYSGIHYTTVTGALNNHKSKTSQLTK